jgi:hypothetical protein
VRSPVGWLAPWAGFVLALSVGRVLQGKAIVQIDELVLGLPPAWVAAYVARRWTSAWSLLLAAGVVVVGFLIGLVAE